MVVPIQFVPHANYIRRRLFGDVPLRRAAYREEILCGEETFKARPAIVLAEQLDRVTGVASGTTIELEVSAATSQTVRAGPTVAYHIKDAIVTEGSIYQGRFKAFIAARSFFRGSSTPRKTERLKVGGLASSHLAS